MREHENRLRRAIEDEIDQSIKAYRERGTDTVLQPEAYAKIVGKVEELKRLRGVIPELCKRIIHDEEDDD